MQQLRIPRSDETWAEMEDLTSAIREAMGSLGVTSSAVLVAEAGDDLFCNARFNYHNDCNPGRE
eukprot:1161723-Pelagomonas_calceolata.AAC.1